MITVFNGDGQEKFIIFNQQKHLVPKDGKFPWKIWVSFKDLFNYAGLYSGPLIEMNLVAGIKCNSLKRVGKGDLQFYFNSSLTPPERGLKITKPSDIFQFVSEMKRVDELYSYQGDLGINLSFSLRKYYSENNGIILGGDPYPRIYNLFQLLYVSQKENIII